MCVCVCVCVFFLNFVSLFFLNSGNSSTYFKVLCRSMQKKKSDHTRCLESTISDPKLLGPRYNINWNSKSPEQAKAFWFSEG